MCCPRYSSCEAFLKPSQLFSSRERFLTIWTRRWIRLLFGREFPFDELLLFWDTLFAVDPRLELVDLICVAMLLRIRWECKGRFIAIFYSGY